MKKTFLFLLLLFYALQSSYSQDFKFAFVTDTHIGASTSVEDLKKTIEDINQQSGLDFVLLTGDITEMGTDEELALAKQIIEKLDIPYYIVPGNHDTGWSESGGVSFIEEFGADKFVFEHEGYKFIGCASGPYVRMSDGHIPRDAVVWLDSILAETPKEQPLIFINHYPLDDSLDNWFEATERLKKHNTQFAICGHGHRNKAYDFEGIPGTMGRSNLRAKAEKGGYNIVEIKDGLATFSERTPGGATQEPWRKIKLGARDYDLSKTYKRPSYVLNDTFPQVEKIWEFHSDANVISTPAYVNGLVIFGNSTGKIEALSAETGKSVWTFQTEGGIFSSPAVYKNKIVVGSGDGNIYSLNSETGKLDWKFTTQASVLGSPIIKNGIAYVGGSDGHFRAINIKTGKQVWTFSGIQGPVVSKPLFYHGKVIFGAWDNHLYALHTKDGSLAWKWTHGSKNRMFSPAMAIPVASNGVVYIVAPDRYLTAIDGSNGKTLWRTNAFTVRESIGISSNKNQIYGKTMNDTIVAFKTNKKEPKLAWKMDVGFGYDHVPSMLFEQNGDVYFGTRNGVVYSIHPSSKTVNWAYKIDNSMVNTINIIDSGKLIAATMDGKVVLLKWSKNVKK